MAGFPAGLSSQLDTVLGEDGVNLSGGQRARLSLVRALLMNRSVLLLDEQLANIDIESQPIILDALERSKAIRTCLAVIHQPMLAERADHLLRLEKGSIVPVVVQ